MLKTRQQQRAREAAHAEVEDLQRENERLRQLVCVFVCFCRYCTRQSQNGPHYPRNTHPPTYKYKQLTERAAHGAYKSGYLNKFRPYSTSSLWANTWEPRYVVLKDDTLTYYRSERDVSYPPRGQISLTDTIITPQGLRRRKFWTFQVSDRANVLLIRLSTEVHAEYVAWLDAFERAGCVRRPDEDARPLSPMPSLGGGGGGAPVSPTHSGMSHDDSGTADTATSARGGGGGGANWRQGEVDSATAAQYQHTHHPHHPHHVTHRSTPPLRRQPSGYTSDASDVGPRPRPRPTSRRGGGGGRHGHSIPPDACAPVHMQARFSLLSSERITITNQRGLLTLMFVIVAATNFRLILENLMKYGLRFNPFIFIRAALTPSGNLALLLCWPALLGSALMALGIERLAARRLLHEWALLDGAKKKVDGMEGYEEYRKRVLRASYLIEWGILILNVANTVLELVGPCWVIHATTAEPLPSFALTMVTTILWLKLVSFAHVNHSLRVNHRRHRYRACPGETLSGVEPHDIEDDMVAYPNNLTLLKFFYFLAAPTLCYQLSYPRSRRIRLRWMLRRLSMFFASLGLMLFFFEQYIEPTIDNSIKPLQLMDWMRMAERVLKLSIPTLYFWLAMFYALFDLWLNILAEWTRFGDREFYKDWWNATTVGEYWRLWNMPVHKWMVRHVYFPALNIGIPKFAAGMIVFFVSAVFHELLVGVPLHMLRGWAFWGIMAQVPLMWVTEVLKNKFKNDRLGNVIFWVSFCFLGQPLAEILYFHDWRKTHPDGGGGGGGSSVKM